MLQFSLHFFGTGHVEFSLHIGVTACMHCLESLFTCLTVECCGSMLLAPSAVKAASWRIEEKQILKGLRSLIALALDIGARI